MKKILISLMALSAIFACQKETLTETPQTATVTFTADADGADTKTVLNETSKYSEWVAGDKITIHNGNEGFEFSTTESGRSAAFSYVGNDFTGNKFLAVYPSGSYTADVAAKTVTAYIPTWQQAQTGTYHSNAALAVAYSESDAFSFKNATALLKFTVNTDNVTHVIFHGNNGEALTGNVKVTLGADAVESVECLDTEFKSGEGESQVTETKKGTWVELYAYHDEDNRYFVKGETYYMAVAPAVLSKGATVKFRINDGNEIEVRTTDEEKIITPNCIVNLGELKHEAPAWAVAGTFNDWSMYADPMTLENGLYVYRNITGLNPTEREGSEDNSSATGFQFIQDGSTWRGGHGDTDTPGKMVTGSWAWYWDDGGKNIYVDGALATDKFDVYLNPETKKYVIVQAGGAVPEDTPAATEDLEWAIVGSMPESGWNNNIAMTLEGDWRVAENVDILTSDEFKFRVGTGWDTMMTYNETAVAADTDYNTVDGTGMAKGITVAASAKYDVYLYKDASKFKLVKRGEVSMKDYSQCLIEIVGDGVAEQTGATKETVWQWGYAMLASNGGKPSVSGNNYTWTWTGLQLTGKGVKIRTKNAAASGDIAGFDCGASAVDKTNSVSVTSDTDGNIIVEEGIYNITFTIDASTEVKKIVIKEAD